MQRKRFLFNLWCVLHFLLVVIVAFSFLSFQKLPEGWFKKSLSFYAGVSGSTQYIFFSPKVASDVRANFFYVDENDEIHPQSLVVNSNEAVLRTYSMTMFFQVNKEMRDFIAQSWAATIYGYHPNAKQVIVSVNIHQLPTMQEYAMGKRPAWTEFYRTVYELKDE